MHVYNIITKAACPGNLIYTQLIGTTVFFAIKQFTFIASYTWGNSYLPSDCYIQCTATCGTGLRTRSVRCLTSDGVIAEGVCDLLMRPVSYEICAQVDCILESKYSP